MILPDDVVWLSFSFLLKNITNKYFIDTKPTQNKKADEVKFG